MGLLAWYTQMAGINLDSGDYLFWNITKTKQGEKISEQGFLIAVFLGMGWVPCVPNFYLDFCHF